MEIKEEMLRRAVKLALNSGCLRGKRGAVMVKEGKIVAEAFNMPLPDNGICQRLGCLRDKLGLQMGKDLEKCRSIHAEAKAVTLAAREGKGLEGGVAYITCMPCMNCAKLMAEAGIKEVYYLDEYGDKASQKFLEAMKVKMERVRLEGDKIEERLRDTNGQK
jgi:dCMP deaminase